jgi:hypothetical protein
VVGAGITATAGCTTGIGGVIAGGQFASVRVVEDELEFQSRV